MSETSMPDKGNDKSEAVFANDARKIENILRISDTCLHVASFLDTVRLTLLPSSSTRITIQKREEICRDLVAVVESLSNAHNLGYASTGTLSPSKLIQKAHKKVKRAEKIIATEEMRKNPRKVAMKLDALQLLKKFNDFAASELSPRLRNEPASALVESCSEALDSNVSASLGNTVQQTCSESSGIVAKLPPMTPGFSVYSPKEVIDFIMGETKKVEEMKEKGMKGSKAAMSELKAVRKYMEQKGLIPCSASNVNRMVLKFKKSGVYPITWGMNGPRPKIELDDITKLMVEDCKNHHCSTFGIRDIEKVLLEVERKRNPFASETKLALSDKALETYKTAIATRSGLIFVKKAVDRNLARERASLSIQNSISMVHVVSCSDLLIGPEGISIPDDAPAGVIWLRDLVSKAHGGVVVTAIPAVLKINTDDSKVFFFMNTSASKEDENEVRLGLAKDKKMRGQYSFNRKSQAGSNRFNGILFRATVSISASGNMAPIVLCVDGFTEEQIPRGSCPEGFVPLEVPALCPGSDTDARILNVGYVVLLREEKGVMARYFEWYDINIREPFVDTLRVNVLGMPKDLISQPPKKFQASLSTDGGTEQWVANVNESRLAVHSKKRNHNLKVAAQASLIMQDADLVKKGFRSMKSKTKILSLSNMPLNAVEVNLKAALEEAKSENGPNGKGLKLPYRTEKTLLEGVKRMPTVFTSSFPSDAIQAASIASGRIDEKYKTFPDGKRMLETIKRSIETVEYETVEKSFTEMNLEAYNSGMVKEVTLDKHNFRLDATREGDKEEQNFGISQERRQRWKRFDHPVDRKTRKMYALRSKELANVARLRDGVEINNAMDLNKAAETMIHEDSGRNTSQIGGNARRLLSSTPISVLGAKKYEKKHLQAIVQVRVTDGPRRRSKFSFDRNRGKIEEVKAAMEAKEKGDPYDEAQFDTWIYVAWIHLSKAIKMKRHSTTGFDSEEDDSNEAASFPDPVRAVVQRPPPMPTNNTLWVEEARKCFDSVTFSDPNEDMIHKVDFLMPVVALRFIERKNSYLPSEKQSHYTMKFVADNLERLARLSILAGDIIGNLADADAECSSFLLPPEEAKMGDALSDAHCKCQGVYTYWNLLKNCHVRIGRVGGDKRKRNFCNRDKEHRSGSLHTDPDSIDSLFYLLYADESIDIHDDIRKAGGKFQDLKMHVIWALAPYGFDNIGKEDGGLFFWDNMVLDGLKKSKAFKGDMEKKKKEMAIYLVEFFFSLLLPSHQNVSLNPGFEAFLCVLNHGKHNHLADYGNDKDAN